MYIKCIYKKLVTVKEGAVPTKVAIHPTNNDKDVESESQELCEDTAESHEQADEVQVKTEACAKIVERTDEEINKMPCVNISEDESKDNMVVSTEEDSMDHNKESTSKNDVDDFIIIEDETGKYFYRKCNVKIQCDACRSFDNMSRKENL